MKKLLLPLLLLSFTGSSFSCEIEAKEKSMFTGKRLGAQLASMSLPMAGLIIILGLGTDGFKKVGNGFFVKNELKWNLFNLIFCSVIYVLGSFYGYFFLEKLLSGKRDSLLRKILSGVGSFIIMGFWGWLFGIMIKRENFEEGFSTYLICGLGLGLFTSILPWFIYKRLDRFIIDKTPIKEEAIASSHS